MFRKYEKTFRIIVPEVPLKGHKTLSGADVKRLINGKLTITEKLDGANTGIIRTEELYRLQKRGSLVDASEHEQFNFFKAWAADHYENIMKIDQRYLTYGELMRCVHTVCYNKLPDWFLVFAIYDTKENKYVDWTKLTELCNEWELYTVPLIAHNEYFNKTDLFDLIPNVSNYGDEKAEGIVIWNYRKQMRGKIARPEFIKMIERSGHWMHSKMSFNSLKEV